MKEPEDRTLWYFVDEAGDPTFFNRRGENIVGAPGCSPILLLGFVALADPKPARKALAQLREELVADSYLSTIPSMSKTARAFHAKDDCPEVRQAVFRLIESFDLEAQFIVARKMERTFRRAFKCKESHFYDHLVSHLFKNVLHRAARNRIFFSKRRDKDRRLPLEQAIRRGVAEFEKRWETQVDTDVHVQCQSPSGEPCLQIADYMNWAVQRAFVRGEMRYFDFVRRHVALVVDLYDQDRYPKNYYDRERNPFHANKISPLEARSP